MVWGDYIKQVRNGSGPHSITEAQAFLTQFFFKNPALSAVYDSILELRGLAPHGILVLHPAETELEARLEAGRPDPQLQLPSELSAVYSSRIRLPIRMSHFDAALMGYFRQQQPDEVKPAEEICVGMALDDGSWCTNSLQTENGQLLLHWNRLLEQCSAGLSPHALACLLLQP
jgi:hypothetical protein